MEPATPPSRVAANIPRTPPVVSGGLPMERMTATIADPAQVASSPTALAPPDAPTGSGLNVTIDRGTPPYRIPTSVDQESAAAVATAPA